MENFIKEFGILRVVVILIWIGLCFFVAIKSNLKTKDMRLGTGGGNNETLMSVDIVCYGNGCKTNNTSELGGTGRPIYLNDVPEERKNTAGGAGYRSKNYQDNNDINVGGQWGNGYSASGGHLSGIGNNI